MIVRLFTISFPPGEVPTVKRYPCAKREASHVMLVFTGTSASPLRGEDNWVHSGIGQSRTSKLKVHPKVSIIDCRSSCASQYGKPSAPSVIPLFRVCSDHAIKVLS